jgi:hypothetical protein
MEYSYSNESQLYKLIYKFEELCLDKKYLFTNTRIKPENHILRRALTNFGYCNTETTILVERGTNNFNPDNILGKLKFTIRDYQIRDSEEIQSMAFNVFNYGRFHEDPYISVEHAKNRNKNWIIDLATSSKIIVGEINTTIFGFMAFSIEGNKASLQLGGVKSNFTIYSYPFWEKVFLEIKNRYEVQRISSTISSSNIRILNLYSSFGFKYSQTYFGYHKHRNKK